VRRLGRRIAEPVAHGHDSLNVPDPVGEFAAERGGLRRAFQRHDAVPYRHREPAWIHEEHVLDYLISDLPADLLVRAAVDRQHAGRLVIPTRRPAASVTGSRLTPRAYISRAACPTVSSGMTVTAGRVIRPAATAAPAFSLSRRCKIPATNPGYPRRLFLHGLLRQHVRLGDDADHHAVVVNDGERADVVLTKPGGHLLERRVRTDTTCVVMTSFALDFIVFTPFG